MTVPAALPEDDAADSPQWLGQRRLTRGLHLARVVGLGYAGYWVGLVT